MSPVETPVETGVNAARLRLVLTRLTRALRREGHSTLSASQVSALATLEELGPMRISTLATNESMDPSVATRIVAGLEGLGLVERAVDPEDKRASLVELSAAGRRQIADLWTERTHELSVRLDRLSDTDRRAVEAAITALEKITRD
jgi:DNA-binding MarR family transcriptional regulator